MAAQPAAITVVIPSYRRTGYLVDVLRDLGRQDCAGTECIVVLQTRPSEAELGQAVLNRLDQKPRLALEM